MCEDSGEDVIQWLAERIEVRLPTKGDVMTISMTGEDPQQLQKIVTAVADAYEERVV